MSENQSFMVRVRDKGEVTLPIELRELMKLVTGDLLGIDVFDNGEICIHKLIPHRSPNNYKSGGENERKVGETR